MNVIQIEMIHKRQNENIAVFLESVYDDLYFLTLFIASYSKSVPFGGVGTTVTYIYYNYADTDIVRERARTHTHTNTHEHLPAFLSYTTVV